MMSGIACSWERANFILAAEEPPRHVGCVLGLRDLHSKAHVALLGNRDYRHFVPSDGSADMSEGFKGGPVRAARRALAPWVAMAFVAMVPTLPLAAGTGSRTAAAPATAGKRAPDAQDQPVREAITHPAGARAAEEAKEREQIVRAMAKGVYLPPSEVRKLGPRPKAGTVRVNPKLGWRAEEILAQKKSREGNHAAAAALLADAVAQREEELRLLGNDPSRGQARAVVAAHATQLRAAHSAEAAMAPSSGAQGRDRPAPRGIFRGKARGRAALPTHGIIGRQPDGTPIRDGTGGNRTGTNGNVVGPTKATGKPTEIPTHGQPRGNNG